MVMTERERRAKTDRYPRAVCTNWTAEEHHATEAENYRQTGTENHENPRTGVVKLIVTWCWAEYDRKGKVSVMLGNHGRCHNRLQTASLSVQQFGSYSKNSEIQRFPHLDQMRGKEPMAVPL